MTITASVYFIQFTKDEVKQLNSPTPGGGWDSELGRAYLAAKDGDFSAARSKQLLVLAVQLTLDSKDPEEVYSRLQNINDAWKNKYTALTTFPRSMDMGDVIRWSDGTWQRVAYVGFEDIKNPLA